MAWFRRTEKGIQTQTSEKKDTPQGLWYKSPTGKIVDTEQLAASVLPRVRRGPSLLTPHPVSPLWLSEAPLEGREIHYTTQPR
jgi:hypothetical protein